MLIFLSYILDKFYDQQLLIGTFIVTSAIIHSCSNKTNFRLSFQIFKQEVCKIKIKNTAREELKLFNKAYKNHKPSLH